MCVIKIIDIRASATDIEAIDGLVGKPLILNGLRATHTPEQWKLQLFDTSKNEFRVNLKVVSIH